jgi:ubiquinone/menaquinone biosynthesis C-methylase UbiE
MTDPRQQNPRPHSFHLMPDEERRKWQDPEIILREIGLKPGDTFVDIGCGSGYFALPAAGIVGETGFIYGVDINGNAVKNLQASARQRGIANIALVIAEAESTVFCSACADIVFFGIDLHDFRDPAAVLRNARKMLKPGGRLIDLDWQKVPSPWGPPQHIRFDEAKAQGIIKEAGFKIESVKPSGPYHYIITAWGK